MDPTRESSGDADAVPLELLGAQEVAPSAEPVPIEELLLPAEPPPAQPARPAAAPPRVAPVAAPSRPPARPSAPPRGRRVAILAGAGVATALVAAAAVFIAVGREEPAPSAPAPRPAAASAASPRATPEPHPAPPPASEGPERLYGGRTAEWWRERLAQLAGRSDEEGRRLHEVTRARAERLGIVAAASAAAPTGSTAQGDR